MGACSVELLLPLLSQPQSFGLVSAEREGGPTLAGRGARDRLDGGHIGESVLKTHVAKIDKPATPSVAIMEEDVVQMRIAMAESQWVLEQLLGNAPQISQHLRAPCEDLLAQGQARRHHERGAQNDATGGASN